MQKIDVLRNNNLIEYYAKLDGNTFATVASIIDLAIFLILLFYLFKIIKSTKAMQLLRGVIFLFALYFMTIIFKFPILNIVLSSIMTYGVLTFVIIFQPEIRRTLEKIGKGKINIFFNSNIDREELKQVAIKVTTAVVNMAKTKTGALIVFENDIKLNDIINNGIKLDAVISSQLIENIFVKDTPLHDGAVIISESRIKSACSILPLSNDENINKAFGTRHRAAIGISSQSDSLSLVVSEETGKISIAKDGKLRHDLSGEQIRSILMNFLLSKINQKERQDKESKSIEKTK